MPITDLTAARLRRPGPNGARILLLAGRSWLASGDASDEHRMPVRLLDRLWLSARRGIELDVVCGPERVLRLLETFAAGWRVHEYDAIVLLPDLGRAPMAHRLQRVIDGLAEVTTVLGVSDTVIRPDDGAPTGWRSVRIDPAPGECSAALVAESVSTALLDRIGGPVPQTAERSPRPDTLADHLRRVALITSSAFAAGSAAIAVLTAGRPRTLAAVGPELGDQGCMRIGAVRPMVVLDSWIDTGTARDAVPRRGIRFFAAHPLELSDGSAMGTISVFDAEPRTADEFDPDVLRDLADLASAELQYAGAHA